MTCPWSACRELGCLVQSSQSHVEQSSSLTGTHGRPRSNPGSQVPPLTWGSRAKPLPPGRAAHPDQERRVSEACFDQHWGLTVGPTAGVERFWGTPAGATLAKG